MTERALNINGGVVLRLVPKPAQQEVYVQLEGVTKTYTLGISEVRALRETDLSIGRGEFVAICGSSGSGKTTLLNVIGCLALPTSGRLLLNKQDVSSLSDQELSEFRAKNMGFVFQNFNLLPVLTAVENVEYSLRASSMTRAERRETALEALAQVGLAAFAGRRPDQLSGGQRQRVAIARAFVHRPELIIADEPTASLDAESAREVLRVLSQIHERSGATVIMASHDARAVSVAQRRIQMSDGVAW